MVDSNMPRNSDVGLYWLLQTRELAAAVQANTIAARSIHIEMATRYGDLITAMETGKVVRLPAADRLKTNMKLHQVN
jgi:ABC-type enterochelin transport system ATPase subunit